MTGIITTMKILKCLLLDYLSEKTKQIMLRDKKQSSDLKIKTDQRLI